MFFLKFLHFLCYFNNFWKVKISRKKGKSSKKCNFSRLPSQVEEKAGSLSTDDVFILESKDNCWIWKGKESTGEEAGAAKEFMQLLCPGREFQVQGRIKK